MQFWRTRPHAHVSVLSRNMGVWAGQVGAAPYRTVMAGRSRRLAKILQGSLMVIILITITVNVSVIVDKTRTLDSSLNDFTRTKEVPPQEGTGLGNHKNLRIPKEAPVQTLKVEVLSSQTRVSVTVGGVKIIDEGEDRKGRGIHVIVLHQATGAVMAQRIFDTYSPHEDDAMTLFLNLITRGRILVLAVKDEGTYQLTEMSRELLSRLGSENATCLGWRDMWAFVGVKGGQVYGEQMSKSPNFNTWGADVLLKTEATMVDMEETSCAMWSHSEENLRRRKFCDHVEGYGSVCACVDPAPLIFTKEKLQNDKVHDIPVVIIASNRPHYLYRSIRSLLSSPGVNPNMIVVFIDGYYEEPLAVAKLFGLRGIQRTPLGVRNARIAQHYKASLTATFDLFPSANCIILLEEDLDVAPDFFSYFSQTLPLLEQDPSLYCISAWNDQGYEHTSGDDSRLYRVETMPGLGWLLKRSLYKEELEEKWPTPEKMWDWDMWMRLGDVRKDRECIIPDVSRTYHFGSSGLNMNSYFQDIYFKKHSFSTRTYVQLKDIDKLKKNAYEQLLNQTLQESQLLDHNLNPCSSEHFFPEKTTGKPFVLFIQMENQKDFFTWLQLAKCLGIWDLDGRGYHKGLWRLHIHGNPILVIGAPYSPYSIFKPDSITPVAIEGKRKKEITTTSENSPKKR